MNAALIADMRSNPYEIVEAVLNVELMQKSSMYGFHGNEMSAFIKMTLCVPKLIAAAKRLLEKGDVNVPGFGSITAKAFEANIDFEIRYMTDAHIVGCNWLELPAGHWIPRNKDPKAHDGYTSRAQLEVDISYQKLISHQPEGEWQDVAPLRNQFFNT